MSELDIQEILENALYNMENYRKTGSMNFFYVAKEQVETALQELEREESDEI